MARLETLWSWRARRRGALPHYLLPGHYWIRNGGHWNAARKLSGPSADDGRTSWALLKIELMATVRRNRSGVASVGKPLGGTVLLDTTSLWSPAEGQLRAVVAYYAEFLAHPPRVAPRILPQSAVDRLRLPGSPLPRQDHLVKAARRRGFLGDRTDLLTWMISSGHITPSIARHEASLLGGLKAIVPPIPYRPLTGTSGSERVGSALAVHLGAANAMLLRAWRIEL